MNSMEFLREVWGAQAKEGFAFLCYKDLDGVWKDLSFKYPRDKIVIPDPKLGDVYFCPNLFEKARRRKGEALTTKWLYADLDTVRPPEVGAMLGPFAAWESSPGRYQALWQMDKWVGEEIHAFLNKRLTYELGADKSGWDITQLLRVPGTINHKYDRKPRVRLMWPKEPNEKGNEHENVEDLLEEFGFVEVEPGVSICGPDKPSELNASEIRRKYQDKMPAWLRDKLQKGGAGDRSKVLWRIECALLEVGLDRGEVFVLLQGSSWNKFENNENMLWRDINRAAAAVARKS